MDDSVKHKLAFKTCQTKEDLHRWIKVFLGLDIPTCIVDPSSTGSPFDLIHEVYDRARRNQCEDFSSVMAYASRDSFKTLGAAIIEILMLCHLDRSVAHVAAIENQSGKAQYYLKKFLNRPILRDYVVGDNKRETFLVRYEHRVTGQNLTRKQWDALQDADKEWYQEHENYVKVLMCTMQDMNSEHVPFMVVDEVDLITGERVRAYEEGKNIPAPRDNKLPITLLTSTRKSYGLVQIEIDKASETGLHVRHWNLIDVTERCPASRHKPELPKLTIYRSNETLKAVSEQTYNDMVPDTQKLYVKDQGFDGCLTNCRLFAMCQGRLATEQKSTSKLLKPIPHTIDKFRRNSLDMAKAQLLCWKPSVEGLIYSRFDKSVHMLSPGKMASKITGDDYPVTFSKQQLMDLMVQRGLRFYAGMDFGFTHNFAVVLMAVDNDRAFVVDVIARPQLELPQKIQACEEQIKQYDPTIFPDMADPSSIKTFKRHGFRMRDWQKKPHSVMGGIETVRMKLWPTLGEPELFLLKDDAGCELLAKRLSEYHFTTDSAGRLTGDPDEADDDECDAFRYVVMNVFAKKGGVTLASDSPPPASAAQLQTQYTQENWFQKVLAERTGRPEGTFTSIQEQQSQDKPKRRGRFCWEVD